MSHLNLNGKTAVVTGASGYIGSILVDALLKHSCKVVQVSRSNLDSSGQTKTIQADVCNEDTWANIVQQADIIYHLAGNTSVYQAAKDPAENLRSTLLPLNHLTKVAKVMQRKPRVVFASTATVYGLTPRLPVSETVLPKPTTIYDLHKLFAEQQIDLATQQGTIESVSLRLANVYGPSKSGSSANDRGVLNKVAANALQGKDLMVYGGGNYLRDYVYITDVVNALLIAGAAQGISGEVFNVASGVGNTVKSAFKLVASQAELITGKPIKVNFEKWPSGVASIEFRDFTADISKYFATTNWRPVINLSDGIALLLAELTNRGAVSSSNSNTEN
jgi:nucleoside-diphosphate-sugar epimerase